MSTPSEILEAIAPELKGDENLIAHVNLADQETGKVFGDSRDHAVALLAAHTLTLSKRGGSGGPVTGESEGSLSRSYGGIQGASQLDSTSYGMELNRLRRSHIFAARTVRV